MVCIEVDVFTGVVYCWVYFAFLIVLGSVETTVVSDCFQVGPLHLFLFLFGFPFRFMLRIRGSVPFLFVGAFFQKSSGLRWVLVDILSGL